MIHQVDRLNGAWRTALLCCCLCFVATAQEPAHDFKELYASAEYEKALLLLAPLDTSEALQYKALCLLALGRRDEAAAAVKDLVEGSPTFVASPDEAPPRFVELVTSVRRAFLPTIARRVFAEGREQFAAKKGEEAITRFTLVLTLVADPDFEDASSAQDLKTLSQGFIDLARATPATRPVAGGAKGLESSAPAPNSGLKVTQAVPLEQRVPVVPSEAVGRTAPILIVLVQIDATGKVTAASVRQPAHPLYDRMVLEAARNWRYRPATINGVPAPSERLVTIQTTR